MSKLIDLVATGFSDLPFQMLEFFQIETEGSQLKVKTISNFLASRPQNQKLPLPQAMTEICDILVSHGYLNPLHKGGAMGMGNSYVPNVPGVLTNYPRNLLGDFKDHVTCLVFGFPYIFEQYKNSILPICHLTEDGDKTIGTGFIYGNLLVTARHCIEGAKAISIRGFSKLELSTSNFKFHANPDIDLAFLELPKSIPATKPFSRLEAGNILDQVITMGYPKVPGFHTTQTVEQAQVSSRLTVTKGSVAGQGTQYFANTDLLLITAKIRGGNSGGPVLNSSGAVIGVAIEMPHGEGKYDDLGYGTVVPHLFIEGMIKADNVQGSSIPFDDFE